MTIEIYMVDFRYSPRKISAYTYKVFVSLNSSLDDWSVLPENELKVIHNPRKYDHQEYTGR